MSPKINPDGTISYPTQTELDQWHIDNGLDPEKINALNKESQGIWDKWHLDNPNPGPNATGPFYDAGGNYIGDPKFRDPNRHSFETNLPFHGIPQIGAIEGIQNLASLYEDRDSGGAFEMPMFNTANYGGEDQVDPFSIYASDLLT